MKNKFKIIIVIIVAILLIILITLSMKKNNKIENEVDLMKSESVMYNENATLNDLKTEYKITGDDNLYEIQTEYDGRKVVSVKEELDYKVAFSGMMLEEKPSYDSIDRIYREQYPKEHGIWIKKDSRQKIINFLNSHMETKYEINSEGYLITVDKSAQNENDKKIEQIINRQCTYILDISGEYYMIDPVTGDIVLNPYEDLERYQTYEYVTNKKDMIIYITENTEKVLTAEEIFESILNLVIEN